MFANRLKSQVRVIALIAVTALFLGAGPALASVCTLADHIRSANTNTAVGFCPAGTSHDIITIAEDITLTEPLPPITGTITIEGGGHTISGDNQFRIFDVSGGNLTIRNLTLREGRADHGGAIRLQAGSLAVYDSSFVGNRTETSAGAIYASGGTLDIRNSRFKDNCAQLATYILSKRINRNRRFVDDDGCVRFNYTRTEIDGELDTNVDGGAIRLLNGVQATIERSVFTENRATYGGAISTSSKSDQLVVNASSFFGNFASGSGGAIGGVWTGSGSTSISNSSFVKNRAENFGGAIDAPRNRLDISNSTFSENHTEGNGGALQVGWDATVTVTHATFIENRARSQGEAISKTDGTLFLRNSIISSSGSIDDCVGGLDQSIGNLSPDRTCGEPLGIDPLLDDITGSPAYYPPRDLSPAVDVAVAEYCLGTDQLGTERPQGGGCDIGAIESTTATPAPVDAPAFCPLPDQIIAANTDRPYKACPAGNGADTIYLIRDFVLSEKLQPITSHITIEGNGYTISGDRKFRIFDVDGGMLTVKNLTMTSGRGSDGGGVIRLQNNGRAAVSDSRFIDNSANSGGAIFIGFQGANNSWVTVNRSSFVGNRSTAGGGAIFSGSGAITVSDSSFVENSAGYNSGAIGGVNHSTRIDVVNSTFIGNGPYAVSAENGATATLTHVTIDGDYRPPLRLRADGSFTSAGRLNLRNSIISGMGINSGDCDHLMQNIGNLIEDGSCSPMLSGDPMLTEVSESPAYLDLQAGSPAIKAADARFCPDSDQIGRARAIVGRCDIGAIESIPVIQTLSDCSVTTTHDLNLRDEPNGEIVGTVMIEETLRPLAATDGWFNVEYQGAEGWISADYVIMQGDCR
ncbi:MAG: SH3 domain-containing protein [Chloroflexi bacterium]|nr:SH3 domain-containing protein [Chloroflexota bacterium]